MELSIKPINGKNIFDLIQFEYRSESLAGNKLLKSQIIPENSCGALRDERQAACKTVRIGFINNCGRLIWSTVVGQNFVSDLLLRYS
jgi:hypothetical protein